MSLEEMKRIEKTAETSLRDDEASPEEDLPTTLARVERERIVAALRASRGNKARAARALGISERLMGLRVKKYALDPRAFRAGGIKR